MPNATRQVIDEQHTLEHRADVSVAHHCARYPDFLIHRDAVFAGDRLDFGADAEAVGEPIEVHFFAVGGRVAGWVNHRRASFHRAAVGLLVSQKHFGGVEQRLGLDDLDAHRLDDRARVFVHHVFVRVGQLDAVALHDECQRQVADIGGVEAVQRLAGDPASVAAVADDPRLRVTRAHAHRLAGGNRDHHAQATAVKLRAARHPRDVARDVEATPELVHHRVAIDKAKRGERCVIADAGMGVFDRELDLLVIGRRQREHQAGDQVEAAAQVVEFADRGERGQ